MWPCWHKLGTVASEYKSSVYKVQKPCDPNSLIYPWSHICLLNQEDRPIQRNQSYPRYPDPHQSPSHHASQAGPFSHLERMLATVRGESFIIVIAYLGPSLAEHRIV